MSFPGGSVVKSLPANAGDHKGPQFNPWVSKIFWSRKRQPAPVFLPGKFHGQRSLVDNSPRSCNALDTTERPRMHTKKNFLLSSREKIVSKLGAS